MESYAPAEFTPRAVQTPPNSIEAERSVLGALLMDQAAVVLGMEMLTAEDFYHPQHAAIFGCMRTLYLQPRAIDIMTLDEELRRTGLFDLLGPDAVIPATDELYGACLTAQRRGRRWLASCTGDGEPGSGVRPPGVIRRR